MNWKITLMKRARAPNTSMTWAATLKRM